MRFCFYGANPVVTNFQTNTDPYFSQVFYTLLSGSPDYLYINPYDGCVKILRWFNKNDVAQIKYEVNFILFLKEDEYISI